MYKYFVKIILIISSFIYVENVNAQLINNNKLYTLKTYGNKKANVRMFSDYDEIGKTQEFYVVFYFEVAYSWFIYTEKASTSHRALSIALKLPKEVEIVEKKVDQGSRRQDEEVYTKDFCIIYRLRCSALKENIEIRATIGWQCCNGMLCTGGNVFPSLTLANGKDRKSEFYRDIHWLWNKMQ